MLHLYRQLIALRQRHPALSRGDFASLDAPDGVLAYTRRWGDDVCTVLINFTDATVDVGDRIGSQDPSTGDPGTVAASTNKVGEGPAFDGRLLPDQAVILMT
jgi:alpha-glucosidase